MKSSASADSPIPARTRISGRPVLGKGRDFKLGSRDMHGSKDVVELVSKTPGAIGYSGMGYTTGGQDASGRQEGRRPAFAPTVENTLNHTYPIARPLLCTRWENRPARVKKYWSGSTRTPARESSRTTGYVPLPKTG